jgi:uncharacterized protein (DUF1330 family)
MTTPSDGRHAIAALAFPRWTGLNVCKFHKEHDMAKAYWITTYRAVSDPTKLAKYAVLAGPAIIAGGGKFLARGEAAFVYESGVKARTVLIEFASVDAAKATHDSPDYRHALDALGDGADRDIRIVEAVE